MVQLAVTAGALQLKLQGSITFLPWLDPSTPPPPSKFNVFAGINNLNRLLRITNTVKPRY
jgi:hypothetical protein